MRVAEVLFEKTNLWFRCHEIDVEDFPHTDEQFAFLAVARML